MYFEDSCLKAEFIFLSSKMSHGPAIGNAWLSLIFVFLFKLVTFTHNKLEALLFRMSGFHFKLFANHCYIFGSVNETTSSMS